MRIRVNVVDMEIRLAVGQHSRKIDLLDGVLSDDVQEEILLRHGVKAVGIKVKALVGQGCAHAVGVPLIEKLCLCRVAANLEKAFYRLVDEIDLYLFMLIVVRYLVQGVKQHGDDLVVEQFVELIYPGDKGVQPFAALPKQLLDFQRRGAKIAGYFGNERVGAPGALLLDVADIRRGLCRSPSARLENYFFLGMEDAVALHVPVIHVEVDGGRPRFFPAVIEVAHAGQGDAFFLQDAHFIGMTFAFGAFQVVRSQAEVLLQFLVENVGVLISQINLPLFLLIADGAQAAHGSLKDKDAGLRLAEHGHPAQRTAVPAFLALVHQNEEALFRGSAVKFVKGAYIVIAGNFGIADIDENLRHGNASPEQLLFQNGAQIACGVLDGGRKEYQFGEHPFELASVEFAEEVIHHGAHKFLVAGIGKFMQQQGLQVAVINGVLEAVGIDDFGKHLVFHIGGAGEVAAGDHRAAQPLDALGQSVDGKTQRGFLFGIEHVLFQGIAKGMMGFVHKNAQLREIAQLEESLIDGQIRFILRGVKVIKIGNIIIDGLGVGAPGLAGRQEKLFGARPDIAA